MNARLYEAPLDPRLIAMIHAVPELQRPTYEEVLSRVPPEHLLLVAEVDGQVVAFKLGYRLTDDLFYSWLGGVVPEYRKAGIARALLHLQQKLVSERGFSRIRVKSMNRYPAMLHLLISEGYQIIGVEPGEKIVFEKRLDTARPSGRCQTA